MRATRGSPRLEVAQASAAGEAHSSIRRLHLALGGLGRVTGPRVLRNDWSRLPQYRWEATSFADVQAVIALLWPDLGPTKRAAARDALGLYLRRVRERRLPS